MCTEADTRCSVRMHAYKATASWDAHTPANDWAILQFIIEQTAQRKAREKKKHCYCADLLAPNQRINSNIISLYKSNQSTTSENSSQTIKPSIWKTCCQSQQTAAMRFFFLTARLNQWERRTRGLDLPPSGLAWPSTTTSLSGCIRFIEAMSPPPQAWDLINVTQLPSKIIMGIMQKSTFCLTDSMWTGRKISSAVVHN